MFVTTPATSQTTRASAMSQRAKRLPVSLLSSLFGERRAKAAARDQHDQASIANIDWNATSEAATTQSARDASAMKSGKPAEEGGEG